jgi:uncharacterized protein (DUF2252 family)
MAGRSPFITIPGAGDITALLPSSEERLALGKSLRQQAPRTSHGDWAPADDRPDPVEMVRARNRGRQQRLIPLRISRMISSPFTFYRGSADIMAHDLRDTPASGLAVQLCGDAHLSNFGLYGSPERHLVADINDFDETTRGRWEWDLKRLAASVELCGRENGLDRQSRETAVAASSWSYRAFISRASPLTRLELHYFAFAESDSMPEHWCADMRDLVERERARAHRRTQEQLGLKLTDGDRIRNEPPVLTPVNRTVRAAVIDSLAPYVRTVLPDIRELLDDYGVLDVAHKVVGVGSVGTRDYIVLLQGNTDGDHLFLQIKEALPSVVRERSLRDPRHLGEQVVDGQRRIQSVSDPFLGWTSVGKRPFYVRQLRDMKGGVHPELLTDGALVDYAELCGAMLGKAHARTGYPLVIEGYCGDSDRLDRAIVRFASSYADQVERDHAALVAAVKRGDLPCDGEV